MEIHLWFTDGASPELFRIELVRADGVSLHRAVRGQFALDIGESTFAWTSAVHAFALLLVASASNVNHAASGLSGDRGTPASALDYALSKQPQWVFDICGRGLNGSARLHDLVAISNRNGKREGPVMVRLKRDVTVRLNSGSTPLEDPESRARLLRMLTASWRPYGHRREKARGGRALESSDRTHSFQEILAAIVKRQVDDSLCSVSFSHRERCAEQLRSLYSNPSFTRVAGKKIPALLEDSLGLPASLRCGVTDDRALRPLRHFARPLRVGVGMSNVGPLTLFSYLRDSVKLPFEVDRSFAHALEIATRIRAGDTLIDHDLVVIASAPAASLFAKNAGHEYLPLMLLPATSQHLVRAKVPAIAVSAGRRHREISLLHEEPSTALFYFDELERHRLVRRGADRLTHHEPWESYDRLACGDPDLMSILFFPYAQLNVAYNNCEFVDVSELSSGFAHVFLFVHRSLASERVLMISLCAAVRNAWAVLLEDHELRNETIERVVSDTEYVTNLRRVTGIPVRSPLASTCPVLA